MVNASVSSRLGRGFDADYYWDSEDEWEKADIIEEFIDSLIEKFRLEIFIDDLEKISTLKELS